MLAQAARVFLKRFPDLHLVYARFADSDEKAPEKIFAIAGPELAHRIHLTSYLQRARVLSLMRRARLLAFPSKCESFGIVVIEAMACGTTVVFSSVGAGPELVEDGITGLLADPYNADDVARKVLALLQDAGLASRLGRNGRRKAEKCFSLAKCMNRTIQFYEHAPPIGDANRAQTLSPL